jgi:hypothetical protein
VLLGCFLPADVGHQVMAELLAGAVLQAADNMLAGGVFPAAVAAADAQGSGLPAKLSDSGASSSSGGRARQGSVQAAGVGSQGRADNREQQQGGQKEQQQKQEQQRQQQRRQLQEGPQEGSPVERPGGRGEATRHSDADQGDDLPPPMIPGNADVPSTVCAMQVTQNQHGTRGVSAGRPSPRRLSPSGPGPHP